MWVKRPSIIHTSMGTIGREHTMKSYYKKLAVSALAATMILPIAACNKKEEEVPEIKSGMEITAGTPWYEAKHITVDSGIDRTRAVSYHSSLFAGADDKYIFVKTFGEYAHPDSIYISDGDLINNVSMADRTTGEMLKILDLTKLFDYEEYWIHDSYYRNGILEVELGYWDKDLEKQFYKLVEYDPVNEKVLGERDIDEGYTQRRILDLGKYRIDLCFNSTMDGVSYYALDITTGSGDSRKVKRVEIKEEGRSVYDISLMLPLDKKTVLFPANADKEAVFYKVDLESGKLSKADPKEYSWINLSAASFPINGSDGNVYYSQGTGIARFNLNRKQIDEAINYSWCNSKKSLAHFEVGDVSGDSILLWNSAIPNGEYGSFSDKEPYEMELVSLKKTANPHTGKKVLELYAPYGWIDDVIFNKISEFNSTNGKYYIVVTDRYTNEYNVPYSEDPEESSYNVLNGESMIGNKLTMDIINGKGPDIYFDAFTMPFNFKDHLVDLTPYVGDLSKDKYFTNMVDLSKEDGKLYLMPLAVCAEGIFTDAKNAGKSGEGFTTEEYAKFLKETLNGVDVVEGVSQPYYFVTLFNNMRNRFIKDGKADFTSEDFKAIAEFVKENVPEKAPNMEIVMDEDEQMNNPYYDDGYLKHPASHSTAAGYYTYFASMERISDNAVLLGLPTSDGNGPAAGRILNFAISANSADPDACGEFLKMLLTDESQAGLAKNGYLSINREIFRETGYQAVDYLNSISVSAHFEEGGQPSKNRVTFTKKHIDQLEQTLLNCTTMKYTDPDIEKILVEEMPAYFSGQKSLEETAKIAQDRVQKVLDERR